MQQEESVRTCSALYHLVVVFGNPEASHNSTITALINETQELIEHVPGSQYAAALLESVKHRLNAMFPTDDANRPQPNSSTVTASTERHKRGLFNFVGSISKELFGLSTQQDITKLTETINKNSKETSIMTHHVNQMLSVLNTTQMNVVENRQLLNDLITASSNLNHWLKDVILDNRFYQLLLFKINILQNLVRDLEMSKVRMLRMRKDLEKGYLSEDLLPLDEIRSLINSVLIPENSKFVTPIEWYYSKLPVRTISLEREIIYSVDLPLISANQVTAKKFISYPTPNPNRNVTLKIIIPPNKWYVSHTGKAIELPRECMGKHPTVCPPTAISRDSHADPSCASALLDPHHGKVEQLCLTEVKQGQRDILLYHDTNSFVLITWGTDVVEGCLNNKVLNLKPGTYLINWSGSCALCTKYHCVPGIELAQSHLRLRDNWQAIKIPSLKNFSELNVNVDLPKELTVPKVMTLQKLLSPEEPLIAWSRDDTSVVIEVIVIILIFCICTFIIYVVYYFKCKLDKDSARDPEEFQQAQPLSHTSCEPVVSPQQAAVILLAHRQETLGTQSVQI